MREEKAVPRKRERKHHFPRDEEKAAPHQRRMEQHKQHRPKRGEGDSCTTPKGGLGTTTLLFLTSPHLTFLFFSTSLNLTLFTLLRLDMISFELLSRIGFSISLHFSKSKRQHHPKGGTGQQHHTGERNTPTKKDGAAAQRGHHPKGRGRDHHSALLYFALLCFALLCFALLCFAVLYCIVLYCTFTVLCFYCTFTVLLLYFYCTFYSTFTVLLLSFYFLLFYIFTF